MKQRQALWKIQTRSGSAAVYDDGNLDVELVEDNLEMFGIFPCPELTKLLTAWKAQCQREDYWGPGAPGHPPGQWLRAVANQETRKGYWEWAASRKEEDEDPDGYTYPIT